MFLFAGFGFKCLAVCYRRNGFYNLSKRSKCCSFMTSSRRLLQKNAAFMILLSFLLLSTSEVRTRLTAPIAVDAPLNCFTVIGKLMVYPQGPTYYNFCFSKQRARDSSLVSV